MQPLMGADSGKLALLNEQNNMMDMITLRFSENTPYSAGDYALYFNGIFDGLYRFKEAKNAGAWDGNKVEQVSLANILKQHESAISKLNTRTEFPSQKGILAGNFVSSTIDDLNDLIGTQYTLINYGEKQYSNLPAETFSGLLFHFNLNGYWKAQFALDCQKNILYFRGCVGSWRGWKTVSS